MQSYIVELFYKNFPTYDRAYVNMTLEDAVNLAWSKREEDKKFFQFVGINSVIPDKEPGQRMKRHQRSGIKLGMLRYDEHEERYLFDNNQWPYETHTIESPDEIIPYIEKIEEECDADNWDEEE